MFCNELSRRGMTWVQKWRETHLYFLCCDISSSRFLLRCLGLSTSWVTCKRIMSVKGMRKIKFSCFPWRYSSFNSYSSHRQLSVLQHLITREKSHWILKSVSKKVERDCIHIHFNISLLFTNLLCCDAVVKVTVLNWKSDDLS